MLTFKNRGVRNREALPARLYIISVYIHRYVCTYISVKTTLSLSRSLIVSKQVGIKASDLFHSEFSCQLSGKLTRRGNKFSNLFKMSSNSLFETDEDVAQANKLSRKVKESPFMLVGIAGFVAAGLIGAYKYRNRGSMSTSVFLMQLRVAAQGTVVGCLTAGLAYTMAKEYLLHEEPKSNTRPDE